MKPLLITSGEPAGIGPDLCLSLAKLDLPVVVMADVLMLEARAKLLGQKIIFDEYKQGFAPSTSYNHLTILPSTCNDNVEPGELNVNNVPYVLSMLEDGINRCLDNEFSALITAPINKAIINQAGVKFSGHTEFLANQCNVDSVVMMLACDVMKMALVTTHLPLRDVADAISESSIMNIVRRLNHSLQADFGIKYPRIKVSGLNPHAGEDGYLGCEEIDIISPAIEKLKLDGIHVDGPYSADTLFTPKYIEECDVFVAMYHDQGLPVLKYAGFGKSTNITLGLPIIRTSVDHGTALDLAGKGCAINSSLIVAIKTAAKMARSREQYNAKNMSHSSC